MKHVMIDLETLSTAPDAAILQIGAVRFDLQGGASLTEPFEAYVSDIVGSVDMSTVAWWFGQRQASALGESIRTCGVRLVTALYDLAEWLRQDTISGIWSHGAGFDLPILRSAYRRSGHVLPWDYRIERDTRTLLALAPAVEKPVVSHDALADCVGQVRQLQAAYSALNRAGVAAG